MENLDWIPFKGPELLSSRGFGHGRGLLVLETLGLEQEGIISKMKGIM